MNADRLTDLKIKAGLYGSLTVCNREDLNKEEFQDLLREILKEEVYNV